MNCSKCYKNLALFAGGVLFGSAGIKLLSSKDAKKAYTHVTAAALRVKDSVMETVTTVQENAADVLASARDINEKRAEQETPRQKPARKSKTLRGLRKRPFPFVEAMIWSFKYCTRAGGVCVSACPRRG